MNSKLLFTLGLATMLLGSCQSDEVIKNPIKPEDPSSPSTPPTTESFTLPSSDPISSIPLPPVGERWVLNETYTDEFNGTELDSEKWYDHHTSWAGRPPGLFCPSQVSVSDGCLVLTGAKMDEVVKGNSTYNVACAAVISKTQDAHFGYYEAHFKANETPLSTTFWLSSKEAQGSKPVEGTQPEGIRDGTYAEEIDICEVIGRSDPATSWQALMRTNMNSNAHFKHKPAAGVQQHNIDVTGVKIPLPDGEEASTNFNTYGCWWRDKTKASFYLNNGKGVDMKFVDKNNPNQEFWLPFSMGVNMVMETYDWAPLPTDEELADPTKNRSMYDWVRAYILLPIDKPMSDPIENYVFENHIHFADENTLTSKDDNGIELLLAYTSADDSQIKFTIYSNKGVELMNSSTDVLSGYGNANFRIDGKFEKGTKYYVRADICSVSNKEIYESDSFSFVR